MADPRQRWAKETHTHPETVAFGRLPIGAGPNGVAPGDHTHSDLADHHHDGTGLGSTVLGQGITQSGDYNTLIGDFVTGGDYSVAIGGGEDATDAANAGGSGAGLNVAVGWRATAPNIGQVAIGFISNLPIAAPYGVAMGYGAGGPDHEQGTISVGVAAGSGHSGDSGIYAIQIGGFAEAQGDGAISIGGSPTATLTTTAESSTASLVRADFGVAIGPSANVRNTTSVSALALAHLAIASHARSAAIAYNAQTTAADQIMLGNVNHQVHIPGTLKIPTGATDGYVWTSDAAGVGAWAEAAGGGASDLDDLSDVIITTPASTQVLRYNGTEWVNAAIQDGDLPATIARDTEIPSFATPAVVLGTAAAAGAATTVIRSDSTILAFDATVPATQAFGDSAATGSAAIAARRDHVHGMPAHGAGSHSLDDLSDVVITAGASGEYVRHNGTNWVDATIQDADIPSAIARDSEVILQTLADAKGDLVAATAADTWTRLAVGVTDGHVLTIDAAEATGMKWAAAAGGGGWQDDGTVVRLVTTTDQVVIGAATASSSGFTFEITEDGDNLSALSGWSATAGTAARLRMVRGRGTNASPTVVSSGDSLGQIEWTGQESSTRGNVSQAAIIKVEVDGTPGVSDMPGRMMFLVSPDASASPTEAMRITSARNVVVGTAALATTATDGFFYITTSAGPPTGVPTAFTGRSPIHIDSSNHTFYVYSAGWKGVQLSA